MLLGSAGLWAEQAELGPQPISSGSARVVADLLAAAAVAARRQHVGRVVKAHRPTTAVHAAIASDAWFFTYRVHGAFTSSSCAIFTPA